MKLNLAKIILPAVLAATIPVGAAFAQAQDRAPPRRAGPSPETLARLHDGRLAMIRESLRLDDAQLKLWAPVEAQMRAGFAARQQAFAEQRQRREQGSDPLSLPDRIDRASQRMTQRAERMKALADAFRPFYASLNDEQKAVAAVVLRQGQGGRRFHRFGRRWTMHRQPGVEQQ